MRHAQALVSPWSDRKAEKWTAMMRLGFVLGQREKQTLQEHRARVCALGVSAFLSAPARIPVSS